MLDTCFSVEKLHESFMDIRKNIHFKYSVQNYRLNELKEIEDFRAAYGNGTFSFSESRPFRLNERGRERYIHPVVFRDRVVIHSFCKNVLIPKVAPLLIYDNCASQKGKGIDKSLDRFKVHLKKYYIEHGTNDGYILQIDCRKYFDNLQHEVIIEQFRDKLTDEELQFLKLILKENEIDVSYMSDEEYSNCMDEVFNAIEYGQAGHKNTGEKIMRKSVGIGSEASQIIGLYYLSSVDNYIKIVRGFKYYARYMDDSYVIYHDKSVLKELLAILKDKYRNLGLRISDTKTRILRLTKPMTYLKTIFILTETGKVIMRKCKDIFKRERKKLWKFAESDIPFLQIESQYRSWRGTVTRKNYHNYRQVIRTDKLYTELFV